MTKEERAAYHKAYYEKLKADPELWAAEQARLKDYRERNKEKERERSRQKYLRNKERYKQKRAEWWAAHPEKAREYARKKREQHPDREKERVRTWYENNKEYFAERQKERLQGPDRVKWLKLLRWGQHKTYLSREKYEEIYPQLLAGPCDICGVSGRMKIDHCHERMIFRGVLCDTCNRGIGFLKDDPALLRKAADYLERVTTTG